MCFLILKTVKLFYLPQKDKKKSSIFLIFCQWEDSTLSLLYFVVFSSSSLTLNQAKNS